MRLNILSFADETPRLPSSTSFRKFCSARRWTTSRRGRSEWWLRRIWVVELQPLWRVSFEVLKNRVGQKRLPPRQPTSILAHCWCNGIYSICSSWRTTHELLMRPTLPSVAPPKKTPISHGNIYIHSFFKYRHESTTRKLEVDWTYWISTLTKPTTEKPPRYPKLLPLQRSDRGPFPWRTWRKRAAQQLRWGNPAPLILSW